MNIERTLVFLLTLESGTPRRTGPLLLMLQRECRERGDILALLERAGTDDAALWEAYTLQLERNVDAMYDELCNELSSATPKYLIPQARAFMQRYGKEGKD